MTNILADPIKISAYEKKLVADVEKFTLIQKRLMSIVRELNEVWSGYDGNNFHASATAYLSNLTILTNSIMGIIKSIDDYNKAYIERITNYYS